MAKSIYTVKEAASALGISRRRIIQLIAAKKLPASRIGPVWIIMASAIQARLTSQGS